MVIALTGMGEAILQAIFLIVVFIAVVALAYFTTKFVAKYQSDNILSKSNIRVVESFRLGNNKFIAIVVIAEEYYAVALGKDEITLIDKIDPTKLKDKSTDVKAQGKSFKEVLESFKNKNENK